MTKQHSAFFFPWHLRNEIPCESFSKFWGPYVVISRDGPMYATVTSHAFSLIFPIASCQTHLPMYNVAFDILLSSASLFPLSSYFFNFSPFVSPSYVCHLYFALSQHWRRWTHFNGHQWSFFFLLAMYMTNYCTHAHNDHSSIDWFCILPTFKLF